jgi:hypothetical protein
VNDLRKAIRQREEGKLGSLVQIEAALGQLNGLLTPAAPLLTEARQVCVIPDDILWEVPFAALKTPKGQYLIQHGGLE